MVDAYDRGGLRPVCAACNRPADEGSCPTCRGYRSRTGPPEGGGPSGTVLLAVAAALIGLWMILLLVR